MTKLDKRLKYQNDDEKPVTISMRLPKELHARLEQYATQHRQSISELVRDGLAWRLSEGDPRGLGDASAKDDEAYYMSKTANALADMRQALTRQEAQIQTIVQALERQATPTGNGVYDSNTAIDPVEPESTAEPEPGKAGQQDTILEYDTTRYKLGRLCRNGHNYHGTGQSLRQIGGDHECLTCKRERTHKSRSKATKATAS